MNDISGICLWCGRWANGGRNPLDGWAECSRPECIKGRVYDDFNNIYMEENY